MSMSLWINGTQLTDFILSTPYKDTIDEELDQLNIQVKSTTRQSFKKFDKVRYLIEHGTFGALAVLDKIMAIFDVVESWKGEKWVYQITCLSSTKILENIIINGMAETYPVNNGLYGQLERVRTKINAQLSVEMAVYPEIIFNSTIASSGDDSVVKNITSVSDFLWDGQVNAREIFNDMLDKADAICVATDFTIDLNGNVTQITIGAVKREKVGREIVNSLNDVENGGLNSVKQVVKGITYNRNSEFACGNIISLTKNAIAKDNVLQAYTPARNTDLTIDDASKWCIITQEPIYTLNEVKVYVNMNIVEMEVLDANNQEKYSITPLKMAGALDITDYVVEKSVFDNMSLSDQSKHLYFVRGQKNIYGLFDKYKSGLTGLFSDTAMENILDDMQHNHFPPTESHGNFASLVDGYFGVFDDDYKTFTPATQMTSIINNATFQVLGSMDDIKPENFNYAGGTTPVYSKKMLFSVNYQPYCDSVVKLKKSSTSNIEANVVNLSVLKNQSDRTIDATKYYDSQQALINRMGNKEMYLDAMIDVSGQYDSLLTLWKLGDYFTINYKKWTITQREIENYNMGKLKVRYTLSKGYNASNIDIQVNRDKRLYGIPLSQYVDRYIIIRQYYADYIDKLAIESWDDFTNPLNKQGFNILEMIKIGGTYVTDKVARCYDNFAVDIERTKYNSTIVNVYTRYCNTDGYKQTITLYGLTNTLYNSLACSDYSRLPFKPYADGGATIEASGYKMQLTNINKDKMERLIFIIKN